MPRRAGTTLSSGPVMTSRLVRGIGLLFWVQRLSCVVRPGLAPCVHTTVGDTNGSPAKHYKHTMAPLYNFAYFFLSNVIGVMVWPTTYI